MVATTIEQSRRLMAVGESVKTADMLYKAWTRSADGYDLTTNYEYPRLTLADMTKDDVPAWSLGALWDLIHPDFRGFLCKPKLNSEELIEEIVRFIEETNIRDEIKYKSYGVPGKDTRRTGIKK